MKYIGPFLRINTLTKDNIENQLFYLAKEAIKHIVFQSKCGITLPFSELKIKNSPYNDISTTGTFSPLLCIYKKANPKLPLIDKKYSWDESTFKKEIVISSNAFMTLCLLELCDYYKCFEDINSEKYAMNYMYRELSKKQLEFYASYLRNEEGVFVDKKDTSDDLTDDIKFENKNSKFKFSDQALLMAAFYKYSAISQDKYSTEYKNFSYSILNMFTDFREELYSLSLEELSKLCIGLNLFYKYSKSEEAKCILMDLSELLMSFYKENATSPFDENLEFNCLSAVNCILLYEGTGIHKFKEFAKDTYTKALDLYNPELGIFTKMKQKKEITFSSMEIVLYVLTLLLYPAITKEESNDNIVIIDIFKRQIIESGLVLSWPDAPNLDDPERYKNLTMKSEDLLDEHDFRMPSIATPENNELAPIFIKYITYNKKKEEFSKSKLTFDSTKNMFLFLLIIHFYKLKNIDLLI